MSILLIIKMLITFTLIVALLNIMLETKIVLLILVKATTGFVLLMGKNVL